MPVITLFSDNAKWTYGPSILTAAGCEKWVAPDEQAFVEIASNMVSVRTTLDETRTGLLRRVKDSHLCDLTGFADRMENVLRGAINHRHPD